MKVNKIIFAISILILSSLCITAQEYNLRSPDGKLRIKVKIGSDLTWAVDLNDKSVIRPTSISLTVNNVELGKNAKVLSTTSTQVDENIKIEVPRKFSKLDNRYNELRINFKGSYAVSFRAFNEGMAYRFETKFKKDVIVNREKLLINFSPESTVFFPEEESLISHYERIYLDTALAALSAGRFCSLPALVTSAGSRVLVTESDLFDYPNMFLTATGSNSLTAKFPPVVIEAKEGKRPDRDEIIVKEAEYIAKTVGSRTLPWRTFTITEDDKVLAESDMVYKLSRPSATKETSWIKPGKVAWDWWNANNIYGVNFPAGINTETYKYYIDFASKYGLEYIILDEGWSRSTTDLTAPAPGMDVEELIRYGETKGVGVILWMLWKPLDGNLEQYLDTFKKWGVKGIKVDFMQRADQDMVNYYERVARECAKRQLLVDFHGAFKPAGLHRAYPNFITNEGLKGAENNKWSRLITPDHNLTLPFIRMVAGPVDYTPGAMINANKTSFREIFDSPMSMGTRCHQLAMYVVYESPLQMLCDIPTNYYKEHESTEFISHIPVTWDETKVLEGKIADYIVVARRKADKWYVGAMTDWTARDFELNCSFLPEGRYSITIMEDGPNAERNGMDYKKVVQEITNSSELNLKLASGGGWAAIIEKLR